MSIARTVLLKASKSPFLNRQASQRAFVKRAVKRFMPGEAPSDALDAAEQLAKDGRGAVLTKLGENLTSLDDAELVCNHYEGILDQILARGTKSVISVKPTQLGLDLSMQKCAEHLETLAAKAGSLNTFMWVDMEDSSYVDRTLELYRGLRAKHAKVGICLQAYLHRTPADLKALLPMTPAIRLVKGAYAEPAHVAHAAKRDTDLAYYELATRMLEAASNGALAVFGTHDMGMLTRIAARARDVKVPDDQWEVHMLYGIRDSDQQRLCAEGHTVKTLISYGSSWFPWYVRRLAERPANVWFVVRSMLPG
jgi:proline dehydrogenase